jgi:phosphate starvation-inducible PhoH-like protein
MYRLYNKEKIDKEILEGNIEVVPIGFMRGRNFSDCLVVIDESQNITQNQLELIITRLCVNSKMIFVGDNSQIDLKDKRQSGFDYMSKKLSFIKGIQSIALKTNHRDPIVEEIINTLNDN